MADIIAYSDGADGPRTSPFDVAELLGLDSFEVLLGWVLEDLPWLHDERLRGVTYMPGFALPDIVAGGRLHYLPLRLSAVPAYVDERSPEVAVITGVPRNDGFAFGSSVACGPALAKSAGRIVIEVDEGGLHLGGPMIEGNIVATVRRPGSTLPAPGPRPPDDTDLAIGQHVASLIPDGATIQFGPGGIGNAIVDSISSPVAVRGGLITEAAARLHERGLLIGPARAPYAWGKREAIEQLRDNDLIQLLALEDSHDLTALSAVPRFFACNTAVQVGLDGACNVERVAGRVISGIGGHADFAAAATRSARGVSIVALRSRTGSGKSTIIPKLETVSTPRSDIGMVVTENGIADLRSVDDAARACRIAAVASPEHQQELTANINATGSS